MACIMIIDDDEFFIKSLEFALEKKGYEVISALGGVEGLNQLETVKPDLILLDIMMRGRDGFVTLQKIKSDKIQDSTPVIILTVKNQSSDLLSKIGDLGFSDYVTKPFHLDDLYSKISTALAS